MEGGAILGRSQKEGTSGCGIVIQEVDREKRMTISKIAATLEVCSALSAEVASACILTRVLNLCVGKY